MRVYSKIVIDIDSGRVCESESFEYEGPVAEAKGSSGSQTSTQLPKWLQPYAKEFIQSYQGLVYDDQGNVNQQPDNLNQQLAGFNEMQEAAMSGMAGMTGGIQGVANTGLGQIGATLGGAYLHPDSNPYLDATYDRAAFKVADTYQNAIAPSIMAKAQQSGNFGGSAMNETMALSRYDLGENLGNLANQIYGGNYASERDRQLHSLGMLPQTLQAGYMPGQTMLGLGSFQQQQAQAGLDTEYQNALAQYQHPFELLSGMGSALGQAGMGSGTSTVKQTGGGGLLGK